MMSGTLVVRAISPHVHAVSPDDALRVTGKVYRITMSGGRGLDLRPGRDEAKVVQGAACTGASALLAESNAVVADLGPGDAQGATSASFEARFVSPGLYTVCYKNGNYKSPFEAVGATGFEVHAVRPSSVSPVSGTTNTTISFTMLGGSGLDTRPGGDRVVVVEGDAASACSSVNSSSTAEVRVVDLGASDEANATVATFSHSFQNPGTYTVCYHLAAALNAARVGSFVVDSGAPTAYSFDTSPQQSETSNTMTLIGGSGLDARSGADAIKIVEYADVVSLGTLHSQLESRGCSEAAHSTVL